MGKVRYGYDIETNGLLDTVSEIWLLTIEDAETNDVWEYSDWDQNLPNLSEGLDRLHTADIIFGHNVIGYDNVVLKMLVGWGPKPHQTVIDTWLLSLLNRYKRPHKHGLAGWGEKLGSPKGVWTDWSHYDPLMRPYCRQDVHLNVLVYHTLITEARKIIARYPLYSKGIDVEMKFAMIEAEIQHKGWVFNMPNAVALLSDFETQAAIIEQTLEPQIGTRCIAIDGKTEVKSPAWRKDGLYTVNTVKHFGYTQESGREERPIEGDYSRVEIVQGKLGTDSVVKDYLFSIGWVPDEFNVQLINGKWVNTTPKITESSLSLLGAEGEAILKYNMLRSRGGILKGWIEAAQKDGRLHGRIWTIGTPSFRCRHEVVANLPGVETEYGKELRALLTCEEGTSIVGADSAGNQMRGLCHDIGNDAFTDTVINGDVHQRNADVLGVPRKTAKPFLYAFLFGGGDGKIGLILTGKRSAKVGKEAKSKFKDSIPGMQQLIESLESQYENTSNAFGSSNAFIRGLDGRIIFLDSPHKALNYRLQCTEAITCKAAAVYLKEKLNAEKIQHYFSLHYHDEMVVVCKDQDADRVKELSVEAFTEAPKWFGVSCMNGAAHIGKTYAEVH